MVRMPARNVHCPRGRVTKRSRSARGVKGSPHKLNFHCTYDFAIARRPRTRVTRGDVGTVLATLGPLSDDVDRLGETIDSFNGVSPSQITQLLDTYDIKWEQAAREYFATIHSWFSLLHQAKFESTYHISDASEVQSDAASSGSSTDNDPENSDSQIKSVDTALFFLCLYIVTQVASSRRPGNEVFCPLHKTIKRIFALLKCRTIPTLELIQAGTFLALAEFGHGDTGSAYRTLSETVTLSRVFGLEPGKHSDSAETVEISWDEEERRSTWWCLFMLDQFVHLYAPTRGLPLLMPHPAHDDLLPPISAYQYASDARLRLPINTPLTVNLSCFQRSAQASILLHKALIHSRQLKQYTTWTETAGNLDRDIRLLLSSMTKQPYSWNLSPNPFALCIGAILLLYQPFMPASNTTKVDLNDASTETRQAVAATSFAVRFLVDGFESERDLDIEHPKLVAMSPALIVCGQEAMKALTQFPAIIPAAEPMYTNIQQTVKRYSQRWRIGEFVFLGPTLGMKAA